MPIWIYQCVRGHRVDVLDVSGALARQRTMACRECGEPATRMLATAHLQQGSGPKESKISRAIRNVRARARN